MNNMDKWNPVKPFQTTAGFSIYIFGDGFCLLSHETNDMQVKMHSRMHFFTLRYATKNGF